MTTTVDSVVIGLDDPALTAFFSRKSPGDEIEVTVSLAGRELKATGAVESVDEKMAIMNLQKFEVEGEGEEAEAEPMMEDMMPAGKPSPDETKWMDDRTQRA